MRCCQIRHNLKCTKYLWKQHKEYLTSLISKYFYIFVDKIWQLFTYHAASYR